MKHILLLVFFVLITGCTSSYLDRDQMKVVNRLFYPDGEWPNEQLIIKAIEIEYEGKRYTELAKFVDSLYGRCIGTENHSEFQCQFEIQCLGAYQVSGLNKSEIVKNLKLEYSGIVCD